MGGVVSLEGTKCARIVLGCCLLAAISGCTFHRTSQGFVLQSAHWSLEHNRESPEFAEKENSDKPELLAWRTRLKGYHLGSRIFHGGEASAPATGADGVQMPVIAQPIPESRRPDLVVD
jgi:hypothetical protein